MRTTFLRGAKAKSILFLVAFEPFASFQYDFLKFLLFGYFVLKNFENNSFMRMLIMRLNIVSAY
jgi:hypothetical protein